MSLDFISKIFFYMREQGDEGVRTDSARFAIERIRSVRTSIPFKEISAIPVSFPFLLVSRTSGKSSSTLDRRTRLVVVFAVNVVPNSLGLGSNSAEVGGDGEGNEWV